MQITWESAGPFVKSLTYFEQERHMAGKKRKADVFAGEGSIAGKLKERRERIEAGDLSPSPKAEAPAGGVKASETQRQKTPVQSAEERAAARIERLRKKFKK
jgi:hypothetical protein